MSAAPQAVLSDAFKDALKGRRLVTLLFTTYTFDSGFFEQEVLPVFLDAEMATEAKKLQLVRIEDALGDLRFRPQVFYDAGQLQAGSKGGAYLDVGRHPVRIAGAFHPKLVCALVEDTNGLELLVACLSANLTRSGWWENVECGHVERIGQGDRTAMKKPLTDFLKWLGMNGLVNTREERTEASANGFPGTALGEVLKFLDETKGYERRAPSDPFAPRFHFTDMRKSGESLIDFLKNETGKELHGMNLEILSPYFDRSARSNVLDRMKETFQPKEVRLYLPEDAEGTLKVIKDMFESYRGCWARLPDSVTKNGSGAEAKKRFVHAKVYRFFSKRPKREFWLVGSANLTTAAHQNGGNMECGFLVERDLSGLPMPDFWLRPIGAEKFKFQPAEEDEDKVTESDLTRLSVRYDWREKTAEVCWDGGPRDLRPPVPLDLEVNGIGLGTLPRMVLGEWRSLSAEMAGKIESHLLATSLFTVRSGTDMALILVQEENGMSHKPGMLKQLTVSEILRYWALLTPPQREELESEILFRLENPELSITNRPELEAEDNFFDQFAGYFHAFDQLEKAVAKALSIEENRPAFAVARLFGQKHDSLGRVLERAAEFAEQGTLETVNWYLLTMCARQSLELARLSHKEFWQTNIKDGREMSNRIVGMQKVARTKLEAENQGPMPEFLEWFEKEFMRRERPVGEEATV